jgi:hypothetical protein
MKRSMLSFCVVLVAGCATRTPIDTPVPFQVYGHVIAADGHPVTGVLVKLSEEHGRLFPLLIAARRELGQSTTGADGGFAIVVTTPLRSERLGLFVEDRWADFDSVYTMRVRIPGPNVIRVRRMVHRGTGASQR